MIGADPYTARGYQVLKLETHLHTRHSDGQHTVTEMLAACRMAGYDAVALTDHNTQSGLDEAVAAAARSRHATYVYVDQPTAAGVLDALRRARLFASTKSRLDFWLEAADGSVAVVGERVAAREWLPRVSPSAAVVSELEVADGSH